MFHCFRRSQLQRLVRQVKHARRKGHGVYIQEWRDDPPAAAPLSAHDILAWCRETVANTRRPMGIARFDLALAAASTSVGRTNLSLPRLVPTDLYPGDSLLTEVERFLKEHGPVTHLAAALFSWGDAAHAIEVAT